MILTLLQYKILSKPILPLSKYLLLFKTEYFNKLQSTQIMGEYNLWVKFFLRMLIYATEDSIKKIDDFKDQEKVATLSRQLTWSHFLEIIPIEDELKREFYATMCAKEKWSVRVLRERKNSMLYERTIISRKPEETIANELRELQEQDKMSVDMFYRDPYMLDFLGLKDTFSEKDLETAILSELEKFILEMGSDFAFMSRQKRIVIDNKEVKPYYNKTGSRIRGNQYQRMRNKTTLKEMHIVRYCDDFKIFTNSPKTANKIYIATKMWLKERLYLDISPEKSKVTNLRKHYTEFLGFKLKVHSKRKKQVVESHISEKSKKRIKEELKEQVKKIQRAGNEYLKQIQLYNSKCLGIHNYYQIATHCIVDFEEIAYVINKSLQNRLKPKKEGTNLPRYIEKRYGNSKQLRYIADIVIIPIGKIKTKNAMNKISFGSDFIDT